MAAGGVTLPRRRIHSADPSACTPVVVHRLLYSVATMTATPPKPTCAKCGYDLAGLRVDDKCPECGGWVWSSAHSITDPVAERAARALAWGRIALGATLAPFAAFLLAIGWFITVPACVAVALVSGITAIVMSRRCRGLHEDRSVRWDLRRKVQAAEVLSVMSILIIVFVGAALVLGFIL